MKDYNRNKDSKDFTLEASGMPDAERMLRALLLVLGVEPSEILTKDEDGTTAEVDYQSDLTM